MSPKVHGIYGHTSDAPPGDIRPYDFRTPEGLDRAHLRSLHSVFDVFVRFAGGVLTGSLRMPAHMKVTEIGQSSWEDFAREAESPAHLIVFSLAPLPGKCILYMPLDFSMAMVDVRLSGPGNGWYPKRALTEIEEVLLAPIVDALLGEMATALAPYVQVTATVTQKAADTDLLQAVMASGFCSVVSFEVLFGEGGVFRPMLCLPFTLVRPVVDAIMRTDLALTGDFNNPDKDVLAHVLDTPVDLAVRFTPPRLTPPEMAQLEVGDIIPLHHEPGRPMTLIAGGMPYLAVLPTAVRKRLAALVVDPETIDHEYEEEM